MVSFRQGVVLSREGGALARMLTPFRLGSGDVSEAGASGGAGSRWTIASPRTGFALDGELDGPVNLASPNPATNASS